MGNADNVVDVTAAERAARGRPAADRVVGEPSSPTDRPGDREAHLLRLSLDLQLDALLFTLGAAAASGAPPPSSVQGPSSTASSSPASAGPLPGSDGRPARSDAAGVAAARPSDSGDPGADRWHSWLAEDLELVETLATVALSVAAPLPAALGPVDPPDAEAVPAALLVRFEAMRVLLDDLAARQGRDEPDGQADVPVRRAVQRVERRVAELQEHVETVRRAAAVEPPGPAPAGRARLPSGGHRDGLPIGGDRGAGYLPGELLG